MREINEGYVTLPKEKWFIRLLRKLRILPKGKWWGRGVASSKGIRIPVYEDTCNIESFPVEAQGFVITQDVPVEKCGYGIPCPKPVYEKYECCQNHKPVQDVPGD